MDVFFCFWWLDYLAGYCMFVTGTEWCCISVLLNVWLMPSLFSWYIKY